jgi:hypothetical protein
MQRSGGSRFEATLANSSRDPISKKSSTEKGLRSSTGVGQKKKKKKGEGGGREGEGEGEGEKEEKTLSMRSRPLTLDSQPPEQ